MSSLEDRIRKILHDRRYQDHTKPGYEEVLAMNVALIKQVFQEEGYVQIPEEVQDTWREYNRMAGFMTGAEWYARFEKIVNEDTVHFSVNPKLTPEELPEAITTKVLDAAKRASGLHE